jgi:hypothetical protein
MTRDEAIAKVAGGSFIYGKPCAELVVDALIKLGVLKVDPEPPEFIEVAVPRDHRVIIGGGDRRTIKLRVGDMTRAMDEAGYVGELHYDPHGLRKLSGWALEARRQELDK